MTLRRQLPTILALGIAQTLAWASSYYLPAVLADPISHDLGMSSSWFFAAFSVALMVSGLIAPRVGRWIDTSGGRQVLPLSNLVFALGLVSLGATTSMWQFWLAWLLLGTGMGLGLYDAAFGALGLVYGKEARRAIVGVTLIAGFSSTVGWPLTAWGLDTIGWRSVCYAWGVAHILLGLPLNLFGLPKVAPAGRADAPTIKPRIGMDKSMILLSFGFAATWTVTTAMATHLPRVLESFGATVSQAIFAGALVGPAMVTARILEAVFLWRFHPAFSTKLACLTHPVGACVLGLLGGKAATAFAILHGSGTGILMVSRGTLPLAIFGPRDYGYRLGIIGMPSRICQAMAPVGFGLLIEAWGTHVLIVSASLSVAAFVSLLFLPRKN